MTRRCCGSTADGATGGPKRTGQDLYDYCRRLKPSLIVNNRVDNRRGGKAGARGKGKNYIGDFGTPEQTIPTGGLPGTDWESSHADERQLGL